MDFLDVVLGTAYCGVAHQPSVLGRQHVNVHLFYFLLLVEVCHDGLRTQSD